MLEPVIIVGDYHQNKSLFLYIYKCYYTIINQQQDVALRTARYSLQNFKIQVLILN
jgi:hypothetical protein